MGADSLRAFVELNEIKLEIKSAWDMSYNDPNLSSSCASAP